MSERDESGSVANRRLLPPRARGEHWWLCTQTCQDYRRDKEGNKMMFPSTGTPEIERPSCRVFMQGHVYAFANKKQLPKIMEPVLKMRQATDEHGNPVSDENGNPIKVPIYIDPPDIATNPYADQIPVFETDVDQRTGKRTKRYTEVGVAYFTALPDDRREAEAIVEEYREHMDPDSLPPTALPSSGDDIEREDHSDILGSPIDRPSEAVVQPT